MRFTFKNLLERSISCAAIRKTTRDCGALWGLPRSLVAIVWLLLVLVSLLLTFRLLHDNVPNNHHEHYKISSRHDEVIRLATQVPLQKIRRLPQAIIIGVRKCGTRALLNMLYLHPTIERAVREVHFFDNDDNYSKGLEWYKNQMQKSYPDQITIEKTPSYFITPQAPERIKAMNASIKLIVLVREPVIRAISDFTQLKATIESIKSSNVTFEQLALLSNGSVNINYQPISTSIYINHIRAWLKEFPRKQILLVNGDKLIEDPFLEIQQVEKFLGVKPKLQKENFYFNETKGFFCWKTGTNNKCLGESKGRKHESVDPVVISKLRSFFAEYNKKFYDVMEEDLGWPEM